LRVVQVTSAGYIREFSELILLQYGTQCHEASSHFTRSAAIPQMKKAADKKRCRSGWLKPGWSIAEQVLCARADAGQAFQVEFEENPVTIVTVPVLEETA